MTEEERERDGRTDRQTDRQTDREREREREREGISNIKPSAWHILAPCTLPVPARGRSNKLST